MDNTTEITSVLLTHITSGKGFKRNKLNYDGQEIYYTIIKLFAVSVILCSSRIILLKSMHSHHCSS